MVVQSRPVQLFCSFAPEDEAFCLQLHNHLRPLELEGVLTVWHNRLITGGTDWTKAVDEQLASASIILLLISPAFFASEYCYGVEMQQAMRRHEAGNARVIPILLRPVDWTSAPFASLSFLPGTDKSVAEWRDRDVAFATIVAGLRRVMEDLASGSSNSLHTTLVPGVWNVPLRRNPHFTGRDDQLDQLDQRFSLERYDGSAMTRRVALTQPQAIKGLGGIGKTQIAVEYAYRSREQGRYNHTFWVNAASKEAIVTSFVTIAEALPAFPAKSEKDQGKLVRAIIDWLEQCEQPWLLIFDNVDDVLLIEEYLPQRGNGSVLLTTRAQAVGSLAASLEVETMGLVEGTQLLLHRAQRQDVSDEECNEATNIVIALDGFPLALDQAGAYIEETECSLTGYLQIYQDRRKALLARRGRQTTNYPDSVATTWSLSFQQVEQQSPGAAEFLRLCAFLSPDRIPEELIKDGAAHWPLLLQQAATDLFTFNQMIGELLKFSLVKRLVEEHMLSIHRLVQAIQMDMMDRDEQYQWAERVVLAVNEMFPRAPEDVATWPQCLRYLEQAQACEALIQHHQLVLIEAADVLDRTGKYLYEHALYTIAESLYQHALHIREQRLEQEHLQMASSLNDLASLYLLQGKFVEAEPLYQRALRIREQHFGPEHPQVAYPLTNLGMLYHEQGKFVEAEPLYQRALRIREQHLGSEDPQVVYPLNGLATLYCQQGKFVEAEPLYQRALRIYEQSLGPEHPDMAYPLTNLANLYHEQGKFVEAELLYQRALRIREQHLGSEHPQVAYPLTNLASLYLLQGKFAEAEPLYQRALYLWEQHLGSEHPEVAHPLTGLADLYRAQGNYTRAAPLYQRALSIREHALEPHHPDTAETLHNFAACREAQGSQEEAALLYQNALSIREQVYGLQHTKTIETREHLHAMLVALGRMKEAAELDVV